MFKICLPVNRPINQKFGANPRNYLRFGLPGHEGIDFACPPGDPVHSCLDGHVVAAGEYGAYGLRMIIASTVTDCAGQQKKIQLIYAHLSRIFYFKGAQVQAGKLIALSGNTGNSGGPHLHLTMIIEGEQTLGYPAGIVDPEPYLLSQADQESGKDQPC